ncbi:MAG TPA: cytochrome c [Candidatus Binatia bacterium]|nr:cytochrome c [Candidatus Binatia bacterium]
MRPASLLIAAMLLCPALSAAHSAEVRSEDLPAGPIRDRHVLMEGIGKNAKIISDAMKSGKFDGVADAAEQIQASAGKIAGLFPPGSTHEKSRAKPEIWTDFPKFEASAKELGEKAGALATTAKSGGDVPAGAKAMFGSCKSCHEQFRVPDKD